MHKEMGITPTKAPFTLISLSNPALRRAVFKVHAPGMCATARDLSNSSPLCRSREGERYLCAAARGPALPHLFTANIQRSASARFHHSPRPGWMSHVRNRQRRGRCTGRTRRRPSETRPSGQARCALRRAVPLACATHNATHATTLVMIFMATRSPSF